MNGYRKGSIDTKDEKQLMKKALECGILGSD